MHTKVVTTMQIYEVELKGLVNSYIKAKLDEVEEKLIGAESTLLKELNAIIDKRWVFMENKHVFYDNEVVALYPDTNHFMCERVSNTSISSINNKWLKFGGVDGEIPSLKELKRSFHPSVNAPIKAAHQYLKHGPSATDNYIGYQDGSYFYYYNVTSDVHNVSSTSARTVLPIYRLNGKNSKKVNGLKVIELWLTHNLIPKGLTPKVKKVYKEILDSKSFKIFNYLKSLASQKFDLNFFVPYVIRLKEKSEHSNKGSKNPFFYYNL